VPPRDCEGLRTPHRLYLHPRAASFKRQARHRACLPRSAATPFCLAQPCRSVRSAVELLAIAPSSEPDLRLEERAAASRLLTEGDAAGGEMTITATSATDG
jgi:hypothetical protein